MENFSEKDERRPPPVDPVPWAEVKAVIMFAIKVIDFWLKGGAISADAMEEKMREAMSKLECALNGVGQEPRVDAGLEQKIQTSGDPLDPASLLAPKPEGKAGE